MWSQLNGFFLWLTLRHIKLCSCQRKNMLHSDAIPLSAGRRQRRKPNSVNDEWIVQEVWKWSAFVSIKWKLFPTNHYKEKKKYQTLDLWNLDPLFSWRWEIQFRKFQSLLPSLFFWGQIFQSIFFASSPWRKLRHASDLIWW